MSNPHDPSDRLLHLETAVAHLQHDFERLHGVALEVQAELRQLMLRLTRLEHQVKRLETPPDFPSAAEERPPHY